MTLFQLFNTLFQNEIIKKDIYLDRLKELKASKEKELEEIIKAMESVQHDKTKTSNNNNFESKFIVGDVLYTDDGIETILEVKYSITVGDYMYLTDKSNGFITQSWILSNYTAVKKV